MSVYVCVCTHAYVDIRYQHWTSSSVTLSPLTFHANPLIESRDHRLAMYLHVLSTWVIDVLHDMYHIMHVPGFLGGWKGSELRVTMSGQKAPCLRHHLPGYQALLGAAPYLLHAQCSRCKENSIVFPCVSQQEVERSKINICAHHSPSKLNSLGRAGDPFCRWELDYKK